MKKRHSKKTKKIANISEVNVRSNILNDFKV